MPDVPTVHTIQAAVHGRYLVEAPAGTSPAPLLVGFHGYRENAALHLEQLRAIVGGRRWLAVSVQALSRFYGRGDRDIVASWMTREDRELAIADNVAYVAAVVDEVCRRYPVTGTLVYVGFSQGTAMAYRAAAFAGRRAAGVIVLGETAPPDVAEHAATLPPVLVGRGTTDYWYTPERAAADLAALRGAGVRVVEHVFEGGHEWHPSFHARAGEFLDTLAGG